MRIVGVWHSKEDDVAYKDKIIIVHQHIYYKIISSMKHYDVIIVWASFAWLSCAQALLESWRNVLVIDHKKSLHINANTTGIIVDEAFQERSPDDTFVKKINKVVLYSPKQRILSIDSQDYTFYTTNTWSMIEDLYHRLQKKWLQVMLGTGFVSIQRDTNGHYILPNIWSCQILVGADGARSKVAEVCGLGRNTRFLQGREYDFSYDALMGKNLDAFHCFLDQQITLWYLGRVVPWVETIQVGVASFQTQKPDLDLFLYNIKNIFSLEEQYIVGRRGWSIPINGIVRLRQRDNIYLVGDAIGAVSPLTAWWIHTAMRYGRMLWENLAQHIDQHTSQRIQSYEKRLPNFTYKRRTSNFYIYIIKNRMIEWVFITRILQPIAKIIFFSRKKLQ